MRRDKVRIEMRRGVTVAIVAIPIAVAVSGAGAYFFGFFDSKFLRTCESILKDRLRSPSGYRRIEVRSHDEAVSFDRYRATSVRDFYHIYGDQAEIDRAIRTLDQEIQEMKTQKTTPIEYKLYIEYDAPNGFGTLIRAISDCTYVSRNGSFSSFLEYDVKVDGMDKLEYLSDAIERSR
jgi:hypothetical protein